MGVNVPTLWMAMPREYFCFDFWFGTACAVPLFYSMATGTTITCSLGRWCRPVFCLSFLVVYEWNCIGIFLWSIFGVSLLCTLDGKLAQFPIVTKYFRTCETVYLKKITSKLPPGWFCEVDSWDQCYKTFFARDLRIFIKS